MLRFLNLVKQQPLEIKSNVLPIIRYGNKRYTVLIYLVLLDVQCNMYFVTCPKSIVMLKSTIPIHCKSKIEILL